jgi:twitching motility two-component system response regulator PilG
MQFRFSFPNTGGKLSCFALDDDHKKEKSMNKKKVLIVEDEESLLKLESILLTSKGYDVTGVPDGQSALDLIETMKPDLVLLDIMLPEIDGFEVCRRIKSNEATKHIPVIMLTAKKSREDMARGEQVGADWYITKPFKSAMVIETIQRFIS